MTEKQIEREKVKAHARNSYLVLGRRKTLGKNCPKFSTSKRICKESATFYDSPPFLCRLSQK